MAAEEDERCLDPGLAGLPRPRFAEAERPRPVMKSGNVRVWPTRTR